MVVGACNPSCSGGWGWRITWTWEVEVAVTEILPLHSSLGDKARFCLKKKKILQKLLRNSYSTCYFLPKWMKSLSFQHRSPVHTWVLHMCILGGVLRGRPVSPVPPWLLCTRERTLCILEGVLRGKPMSPVPPWLLHTRECYTVHFRRSLEREAHVTRPPMAPMHTWVLQCAF